MSGLVSRKRASSVPVLPSARPSKTPRTTELNEIKDGDLVSDETTTQHAASLQSSHYILPSGDFTGSALVTLLVGETPQQQEMLVHTDFLCRSSAYFTAALKKHWIEGQTRVIRLPEQSPAIMSHYLEFAYSGKLPTLSITAVPLRAEGFTGEDDPFPTLAELYVYGERFINAELQRAVIDEIFRLSNLVSTFDGSSYLPSSDSVGIVYRGTTATSPARRLMVDLYATYCGEDDIPSSECEQAFWRDLVKAFCRKYRYLLMADEDTVSEPESPQPENYY